MLLRHNLYYLAMKCGTGLVSLLTVLVFTRLMSPQEYGVYAMLLSGLGICYAIFFQWLSQGLGRFYANDSAQLTELISTVVYGFAMASILCLVLWGVGITFAPDASRREWLSFLPALVFSYSWYELNLRMANASLRPRLFGYISFSKASLGLLLGAALYNYFGLTGVFSGLVISAVVAPFFAIQNDWLKFDFRRLNRAIIKKLLAYGLPLSLTVMLTLVVDVSDRFLIASILDAKQAGLYSASYDLVVQTMGFIVAAFYLGTFPALIRDVEANNSEKIKAGLGQYSALLFATSLPLLTIFAALPGNISSVIFGAPFQESASQLIPVIACGIFVGSFKIHYFDIVFQLGRRTLHQIWPALLTAAINVALNLYWIPIYGIIGAAYATLFAFASGVLVSAVMAGRILSMPRLGLDFLKISLSGICMYALLLTLESFHGLGALIFQILSGLTMYAVLIFLLDVANIRRSLLGVLVGRTRP